MFNSVEQNSKRVENCIILLTKFYIYRARCQNVKVSKHAYKNFIKEYHDVEENIAKNKGKHSQHLIKWDNVNI